VELTMPKTLDKGRAKERAALAQKAGCLYRPDIEIAHFLDRRFRACDGIRPVVRWGDEAARCWLGPVYGTKDRSHALYHAEIAADAYRRYFLMHDGSRYEVEQRARHAAEQAEKKRIMELRKVLTNDRVAMYDALAGLVDVLDDIDATRGAQVDRRARVLAEARRLLEQHREAAEAIRKETQDAGQ
jgi:hypothetical protein